MYHYIAGMVIAVFHPNLARMNYPVVLDMQRKKDSTENPTDLDRQVLRVSHYRV